MNTEFLSALDELETTRGIPKNLLLEALEDALISAYKRTYGSSQNVRVEIDKNSGDIHVFFRKEVVEEVLNDKVEMSLEEAREYDPEFEIGDMFESEVTPRSFGRIAALTAKQVVIQRLREAERNIIYDAYANDEGEIVRGTITRIEGPVVVIDMGKT
ncbi:MAG: transcription termination/antitermination protein NusA, partial [Firmicutes bacterium]|nr:transcription termination/antitermination protein NusA [Bacillota bacterium]